MTTKIPKIGIVLSAVMLIIGLIGGYFASSGNISSLQTQLTAAQEQVSQLQSQVSNLQSQITALQSDKTTLQGQVTSLMSEKTALQSQVSELQAEKSKLESENSLLKQNITNLMNQIQQLKAIHSYQPGAILTTLSGGYEDRTGPAFHIPQGNIKITVQLTALGDIRGFYLSLYKVGHTSSTWRGSTETTGEWINYVYNLEDGDYYLKVGSVNYNWKITVQVYG